MLGMDGPDEGVEGTAALIARFAPHIAEHDWNTSALGPIAEWPRCLKMLVAQISMSAMPSLIRWGPGAVLIYNAPAVPLLGPLHPSILGQSWGSSSQTQSRDIHAAFQSAWQGDAAVLQHRPCVFQGGGAGDRWFDYFISPALTGDGDVGGVMMVCVESTISVKARHLTEAAVAEQDRMRALLERAPGCIAVVKGPEHVFEIINEPMMHLVGARDLVGRRMVDAVPEMVEQGFVGLLDQVYRTGKPVSGRRSPVQLTHGPDGELRQFFFDFVYQPTRGVDGEVTGVFIMGTDVTDHVEAIEARELLLLELNHRVKNTLAVVLAIARLSAKTAVSIADYTSEFTARVEAMANTHDLLTTHLWTSATMAELIALESGPFVEQGGRVEVTAERASMSAETAVKVSLILHELFANAAKHGALATPHGQVTIDFRAAEDGNVLEWREVGCEPPAKDAAPGFGTTLIDRLLRDLRGKRITHDSQDGAHFTLHFGRLPDRTLFPLPLRAA